MQASIENLLKAINKLFNANVFSSPTEIAFPEKGSPKLNRAWVYFLLNTYHLLFEGWIGI